MSHWWHLAMEEKRPEGIRRWFLNSRLQRLKGIVQLLLLFGLAAHLSVPRLDPLLLHRQGAVHIVELVIEATGVTDRVSACIPSPQGGGACVAITALGSSSLTDDQAFLWSY